MQLIVAIHNDRFKGLWATAVLLFSKHSYLFDYQQYPKGHLRVRHAHLYRFHMILFTMGQNVYLCGMTIPGGGSYYFAQELGGKGAVLHTVHRQYRLDM